MEKEKERERERDIMKTIIDCSSGCGVCVWLRSPIAKIKHRNLVGYLFYSEDFAETTYAERNEVGLRIFFSV